MFIIIFMTVNALADGFNTVVGRCVMTSAAFEVGMSTIERKMGFGIVVETPNIPAIWGVTIVAGATQ